MDRSSMRMSLPVGTCTPRAPGRPDADLKPKKLRTDEASKIKVVVRKVRPPAPPHLSAPPPLRLSAPATR